MKFGIQRKINLGKYGLEYEALDLIVEDANTWEEAEKAINEERLKIHKALIVEATKRLKKLNEKVQLTTKEEKERDTLKEINHVSPF